MLSEHTGITLPWGTLSGIRPVKIPMQLLEEGKSRDEIASYMKDTYYCSDGKTKLSLDIAKRELALLQKLDYEHGYSIYIGIPFCPSTCLYCSFTSYPLSAWRDRVDAYLDALEKEIDFTAEKCKNRKLNTIYIGGGTPTTLSAAQLDRLIRKIKCSFDLSDLLEFTVEAGRPDSITKEKLEVLHESPCIVFTVTDILRDLLIRIQSRICLHSTHTTTVITPAKIAESHTLFATYLRSAW